MDASTTAPPLPRSMEMPQWKTLASHAGAAIVAFLFLIAGIYKAVDPYKFAGLAQNLMVWDSLTLPLALSLAVLETTAGVLVIIPRFRRWGAALAGVLLLAFMGYIGWNYTELLGRDCSCFPVLNLPLGITIDMTRSVGPEFFWGDAAFLVAAGFAGWWAKKSRGLRNAMVILGAVAVFVGASFGMVMAGQSGQRTPVAKITADGAPMSLESGKVLLFFYDPYCGTCFAVGERLGQEKVKQGVTVVALATGPDKFQGPNWVRDTQITAKVSDDADELRKHWVFDNPPYMVLLEDGVQKGVVERLAFSEENLDLFVKQLRDMGVVE